MKTSLPLETNPSLYGKSNLLLSRQDASGTQAELKDYFIKKHELKLNLKSLLVPFSVTKPKKVTPREKLKPIKTDRSPLKILDVYFPTHDSSKIPVTIPRAPSPNSGANTKRNLRLPAISSSPLDKLFPFKSHDQGGFYEQIQTQRPGQKIVLKKKKMLLNGYGSMSCGVTPQASPR